MDGVCERLYIGEEWNMKKIRITFSKDTVHVDAYKVGVNEIKSAIHALLIGLHDDF